MKTGTIVVSLATVVVVAGLGYAFLQKKDAADAGSQLVSSTGVGDLEFIHVDDLAVNPDAYAGVFVLKAVVAKVNTVENVISVIDLREFENCGELTCAKYYLPVKVTGDLPEPATTVLITGQLVRDRSGLAIQASELRKLP